jgi:uncharacterized protein YndB with AHSA1/START domain
MVTQNSEATTSDREIRFVRVFDAPRELVFDAWTSEEHLTQWFGPRGFTMTVLEADVRPGGVLRFIFHGPDGTDYDNKIAYKEITRPERLVYEHGSDNDGPADFLVTAVFAEQGKGTKITMQMLFPTTEARDKTIEFGAVEGANQTMDRLAEYLAKKK